MDGPAPLRTIRFFDSLGRPTETPDALRLELERQKADELWLCRQLKRLGKEWRA